jgi:multidrug efflux pump subunit AcrA (membrane-fusion protein)
MEYEHNILQYTCECRYELGTVKLVPGLLAGKGKPGSVATGKTGSRKVTGSRAFTGEVKLSEEKTVHVAPPLPGVIRKVYVDIGATVVEGAPLFEIDSHDVAESKGDFLKRRPETWRNWRTGKRRSSQEDLRAIPVQEAQAAWQRRIEVANSRSRLLRLRYPRRNQSLDPKSRKRSIPHGALPGRRRPGRHARKGSGSAGESSS